MEFKVKFPHPMPGAHFSFKTKSDPPVFPIAILPLEDSVARY